MKKRYLAGAVAMSLWSLAAQAVPTLHESAININGSVTGVSTGVGVNDGGFNYTSGLGSILLSISGVGSHAVDLFVDHEFDTLVNTYFNEIGANTGILGAGQRWEIDEPGWFNGDIYENFQLSALDNGIGTSVYGNTTFPDDVSMALGWDFSLLAGETAYISYWLSETQPGGGFYLKQTDPHSQASLYFYSTLDIRGGGSIPEPSTLLLLGMGALAFGASRRSRRNS
ncbi:MAG: hypothetical protein FD130_403 [Halothiobacillaceae bacterium]|nr:MAG: hypothetical protein FD130_403 [Halothiobacillaceae bacterium]